MDDRPVEQVDLLIEDVEILTPDDEPTSARAGSLAVQDGRIVAVADGRLEWPAARTLQGTGLLAIPGLVNAHAHAAYTLSRGWEPAGSLDEWLPWVFSVGEQIGPDEAGAAARLAFAEMLLSGITTCVDHHYATAERANTAAVARAAADMGIRVALATTAPDIGAGAARLDDAAKDLEVIAEIGSTPGARLTPWIGLASPGRRESPERSQALARLARSSGARLTYHYAETSAWLDLATELGHARPVDLLRSLELLGPDVLLAHGVWFSEPELEVLAASGTAVAHNPVSNMYLGDGVAPVLEMLERGIPVALGTDGANCNHRLDLFASMKGMALLQRTRRCDGSVLPAADAFRAATAVGAAAVGMPSGGHLVVGAPADITLIDTSGPAFQPGHDRLADVVFVAAAGDVHTVIVGGEILVEDRRLTRQDLADICSSGAEAGRRVVAAARRPGPGAGATPASAHPSPSPSEE